MLAYQILWIAFIHTYFGQIAVAASPPLYTCQITAYQTTCVNGPCNIHIRDASSQQDLWTKTNLSSGTYTISWEPNVAAVSHMAAKSCAFSGWSPRAMSKVSVAYALPILLDSDSSGVSANNAATVVNSGSSDCNINGVYFGGDDSDHMGGTGAPFTLPTGNSQDSKDSSEDSSDSEDAHGDSNMNGGHFGNGNLQSSTSSDGSIRESSATSLSSSPSAVLLGSLIVVVVTSMFFGAALLA
ncbi:BQ5605_C001g00609 [Microbotryum silenes-dioicae]|uniref:BQ5605_C001g00609 protein n=1 Tax=Microbotryum silenes-dioicae TaxID=796604 RepID=A0A2X0M779_9BASI|nr:BQ5605_C001g00609 [Microbotryum silenes-dioicae]